MITQTTWEQVAIPMIQGGFAGVAAGLVAYTAGAPMAEYAVPVGIAAGLAWTAHGWNSRVPKKFKQPTFTRMSNRAPSAAFGATVAAQPLKVDMTVHTPDNSAGNMYRLTFGQYEVTKRIAFHLTYLKGSVSVKYMVEKWHILSREARGRTIGEYQALYIEKGWIARGNPNYENTRMCVTDLGKQIFAEIAKSYRPTRDEIRRWEAVKNGGTTHAHTPHTHTKSYPME